MSAATPGARCGFLAGARAIAGRELAAYLDSRIAYVYTIAFVLLANLVFMNGFFLTGTVDMTAFFELMPWLLPVFLPAVAMRLWAEERRTRTIELLLTMPIRPLQAVLGKYAAALALFLLSLAGTLPIPVMLVFLGDPDVGLIASGYLGVLLCGAMFLALGMFVSALASDQIVAFVVAALVSSLFVLTGWDAFVAVADGRWPWLALGTRIYEWFSLMPHFEACVRGVIGLSSLVYLGGLSLLFLWANALALERKRA